MERLPVWVSAGLLSAGVSAAVLAGAGIAAADDSTGGSAESTTSADSSDTGSSPDTKPDPKPDPEPVTGPSAQTPELKTPGRPGDEAVADTPKKKKRNLTARTTAVTALKPRSAPVTASAPERAVTVAAPAAPVAAEPVVAAIDPGIAATARIAAQPTVSLALAAPEAAAPVQAAAAPVPSLMRWLQGVANRVVNGIGSLAINSLQALEALVTGPPSLPANSNVTVRSSSILLSNGQRVKANWYYPDRETVPEKMIVLQHGFLALGPMYSHTAARLAESTGSIVVTPTLPSNWFGGDDHWLGGDGMAAAIADLFDDDRAALTDSARAAGFATRYGLDPATAALPQKFGLAGHSLGGQLVTAAAGYLVDNGAAADLVGVITLDGVPTGNTMAVSLGKLAAYEAATGHYIPIREIGAPSNYLNSSSNVKEALNAARPGRFNGVVLKGGVHMDSMRGGNPIIQFAAYLIAGFPKPYNPPAVDQLSATWFNEWFAGDTDNGDELAPGSTLTIPTPNGTAQGVVIGSVPAARFITVAV